MDMQTEGNVEQMNFEGNCSHVVMFFAFDCAKVSHRLSSYGFDVLRNRCVT
jgi:hypothetical protein